jgi:peptidoglycan/LPS O-acetylase OafA/YrhL
LTAALTSVTVQSVNARARGNHGGLLPSWVAKRLSGPREADVAGPALRHRDDLQGLRAVAVLLVAFSHAGVGFLKGGFVGVDVFFVLSGFLITGLLLKEANSEGTVSIGEFYARRVRRILPAAALTLVVTDIAAYRLLNFVRAKQVVIDSLWASVFAANVHFARQGTDYFAQGQPPSSLQHFWTLAVEEQFYVVWPALLAFVLFGALASRRWRHRRGYRRRPPSARAEHGFVLVALAIFCASLAWSIHGAGSTASYFSTFSRAWELALGAILAFSIPKLVLRAGVKVTMGWVGLVAIAAAGVLFSSQTRFPGYAALLPTLGAALVIVAGSSGTPRAGVGRLLALAPMRYIGDRSYAFYLWHWPVLIIAVEHEGHELSVKVKLVLLLAAFLLSAITYGLYENPIRRMELSRGALTLAATAPVAAVIFVAAFTLSSIDAKSRRFETAPADSSFAAPGFDPRLEAKLNATSARLLAYSGGQALPAVAAAAKAARGAAPIPSRLTPPISQLLHAAYITAECSAHQGQTTSNICHMGNPSSTKSLVVFGDSHAEMWMPAILNMAREDGYRVIPLLRSGCTPGTWTQPGSECRRWYAWALRTAKALHPTVTLITGNYASYSPAQQVLDRVAIGTLASTATTMHRVSKRVVVLGDPPAQTQQPVDCLLAQHATMERCTNYLPAEKLSLNKSNVSTLSSIPDVGFIDTTGWFCDQQSQCPMVVGHTIVYTDTGHITKTYAEDLTEPLRAAFKRALRT